MLEIQTLLTERKQEVKLVQYTVFLQSLYTQCVHLHMNHIKVTVTFQVRGFRYMSEFSPSVSQYRPQTWSPGGLLQSALLICTGGRTPDGERSKSQTILGHSYRQLIGCVEAQAGVRDRGLRDPSTDRGSVGGWLVAYVPEWLVDSRVLGHIGWWGREEYQAQDSDEEWQEIEARKLQDRGGKTR